MSKNIAKFRKNSDYSDDYDFSQSKKTSLRNNRTKKLIKYDYDQYLSEYDGDFMKPSKKRAKRFN